MTRGPDFSSFAETYRRARPRYPDALFDHLAALAPGHSLAWDCATGNGQAAVSLAERFERVIATDISPQQIEQAIPHERVEYRASTADDSGIASASVDLITVAQAVHWFDRPAFFSEAKRVARPGGILAVWTYHLCQIDDAVDGVLSPFYWDVVRPYFPEGIAYVDDRYERIGLPEPVVSVETFDATTEWALEQLVAFIYSWSGTQERMRVSGDDPVAEVRPRLAAAWGETQTRPVRWPIYLRASRL